MTELVHVGLGDRAYDIHIGPGLLGQAGALVAPLLRRPRVVIVTDEAVGALHLATLQAGLRAGGIDSTALALPPARPPRAGRNSSAASNGSCPRKSSAAMS